MILENKQIETQTDTWGERRITNPSLVEEVVDNVSTLPEDGEFAVENPHMNNDPRYLRISGDSRAAWFSVIDNLQRIGMEVADVWQSTADKNDDRLHIKVEPVEDDDV